MDLALQCLPLDPFQSHFPSTLLLPFSLLPLQPPLLIFYSRLYKMFTTIFTTVSTPILKLSLLLRKLCFTTISTTTLHLHVYLKWSLQLFPQSHYLCHYYVEPLITASIQLSLQLCISITASELTSQTIYTATFAAIKRSTYEFISLTLSLQLHVSRAIFITEFCL